MFTKNVYNNMFPQTSSSSYPHTSAANGGDIFLNHYSSVADFSGLNEDPPAMENPHTNQKASKKDRHSKIYTSQGPRDRRVRLSIGVARKFFDLQESLGFDKPSKTLDWLLTKSKTAIKDLVEMREKGSNDNGKSGSSAASEEVGNSGEADSEKLASDKLKGVSNSPSNLAKESRVKARARARERTREKMSIKKLNNGGGGGGGGGYDLSCPNVPIQFMNNINQDLIEESILIKRKVKHHPSMPGFQQNLIISSSNYGGPAPYTAADHNWDISSCFTSSQSNICAILDQHKFMNG